MASSSVANNQRFLGGAANDPTRLSTWVDHTWHAWRSLGVLTTPAPAESPVSSTVVNALAAPSPSDTDKSPSAPTPSEAQVPLLVIDPGPGKLDQDEMLQRLAFYADVFARSVIRVSAYSRSLYDQELSEELVGRARDKYELPAGRIIAQQTKPTSLSGYRFEILPVN
jgi:hypothetical protein